LLSALAASAGTVRVEDSLERAVAKAMPGDTVLIPGPAIFHEHVILDKPLRLLGTNAPVLDGGGTGTPLTIRAADAEVLGLTVRNGGTDLGGFDSGIMIEAPRVRVAECRVEGGGFGIYIHGVDGCRIERNTITGNTNVVASKRGNGIHLWKTSSNTIAGNFITGTRDGAYFSYADNNLIASNQIQKTRFGIHYMYSNRNRLLGNTLTFNAVGAALMFARDCRVEGNCAIANRRHGILLKQVERSSFVRNAVWGQNRGFFIQQAAQDRFEENLIAHNDIGLYLSNGSEQNTFVGNAFIQNTDQVWQPPDEVELGRLASNRFCDHHHGNFWSDYTGSDAEGDGVGDTPYHETDLYGYMVDRHPEARVFALSPAVALLRKGEELLPLLNTEGVTDPFPLMRAPASVQVLLPDTSLPNVALNETLR
jgi:nitrous oxidase accessory protein